jgi:gas vesicle protein
MSVRDAKIARNTGSSDSTSAGALLLAFGCGLLTGAIVAALVAPSDGRETREWVRRNAKAAGRRTGELVRERRQQLRAFIRRHGVIGLVPREEDESVSTSEPPEVAG